MRKHLWVVSLILLTLVGGAVASAQEGIDPDALPNFATLTLGGTETYWLDPTLVSVVGGVLQGDRINASTLGAGCTGIIPVAPDVVVNWEEDTTIDKLRIFFFSTGDPTMVVVTPNGETLCNDDVNPLVLDPMIEIENPASGRYAIFMGSFEGDAIEPGFLVFTSSDLNPATLDLSTLVPAETNPDAIPTERLPASILLVDTPPADPDASTSLEAGFGSFTQEEIVSGGSVPAFNIDLGNDLCTGFVDPVPTFVFTWTGDAEMLRVYFETSQDSTLIVLGPDGSVTCNDDFVGADNLNPLIDLTPVEGRYVVYVGSFAPGASIDGMLTITESTDNEPAALTSADLAE
ncbi:MAG: hypothetical protein KC547_03985 [Anaerolineae bacterium]|nr:hypothetical protein [Anaerolineae bacterium]